MVKIIYLETKNLVNLEEDVDRYLSYGWKIHSDLKIVTMGFWFWTKISYIQAMVYYK